MALLRTQAKKPGLIPTGEQVPEGEKALQAPLLEEKTGQQVKTQVQAPGETPVPASQPAFSDVKKTVNGSVVTWEGTIQGKPIHVRIFCEPDTKPIPELREGRDEVKLSAKVTLVTRLKNSFEKITVEPPSANQRSKHIAISED
jgi:hypothetical protein